MADRADRHSTPETRRGYGIADSGHFLSQAIVSGVPAGLAAGLWGAICAAFLGMPWWSPLALYSTHMAGLSRVAVVAPNLGGAVVAGCVWLALLGMAVGALWGLIAGVAAPRPSLRGQTALFGFLFGVVLFGLAVSARVALLPPSFQRDLPAWTRAVALGVMAAVIGAWAAEGRVRD